VERVGFSPCFINSFLKHPFFASVKAERWVTVGSQVRMPKYNPWSTDGSYWGAYNLSVSVSLPWNEDNNNTCATGLWQDLSIYAFTGVTSMLLVLYNF
jgi:hypothetical protein